MSDPLFERVRRGAIRQGKSLLRPEDVEKIRKIASDVTVPAAARNQKALPCMVSIPDVKALSSDRGDRREARELRRDLARIAAFVVKAGLAMQAVQSVNTFVVHTVDQAQEDMMSILMDGANRYEGGDEVIAAVVSQSLQQTIIETQAIGEIHFKRQIENL